MQQQVVLSDLLHVLLKVVYILFTAITFQLSIWQPDKVEHESRIFAEFCWFHEVCQHFNINVYLRLTETNYLIWFLKNKNNLNMQFVVIQDWRGVE